MPSILKWFRSLFIRKHESPERGNWDGRFDFFVALLGFSFSPRAVWWFPALFAMYGGAVFLVPYLLALLCFGLPLMILEVALGQFTSQGVLTCWQFAPVAQGIGIAKLIVSAYSAIYFNMINGWHLFYTVISFKDSKLPWAECDPEWSDDFCATPELLAARRLECKANNWTFDAEGMCIDKDGDIRLLTGFTPALLPSQQYFDTAMIGTKFSTSIDDIGLVHWQMALCLLACFVIVFLVLSGHLHSWGKFVYVSTLVPMGIVIYLLVRGQELKGSERVNELFFNASNFSDNVDKLKDRYIWMFAAAEVMFTMSTAYGGHLTMASYNRFKYNFLPDCFIVVIVNFAMNMVIGYMVFSFASHLALLYDSSVTVANADFAELPAAFAALPDGRVLAGLFYLAMFLIGLNYQFGITETVRTALTDAFPVMRKHRLPLLAVICVVLFLLALPLTTDGGLRWLLLMDNRPFYALFYLVAFLDCIAVIYLYGFQRKFPFICVRRWITDMRMMVGKSAVWVVPLVYFVVCWALLVPAMCMFVVAYRLMNYKTLSSQDDYYRTWADVVTWLSAAMLPVAFLVGVLLSLVWAKGDGAKRIMRIFRPTDHWGPALEKYRQTDPVYADLGLLRSGVTHTKDMDFPEMIDEKL